MSLRRGLLVVTVTLFLSSVYINVFLNRREAVIPREPLASIPMLIHGWRGVDVPLPPSALQDLRVSEYVMRRFTKGNESIWVYIGYYRNQVEGAMPHSPRHCYPGNGFTPIRRSALSIPVGISQRADLKANLYVFAKGNEREVVIYWYQSRGRVVASEFLDRLYLIRDSIVRNRRDGALVRFSTGATAETEPEAVRSLAQFVSVFYPCIPRVIPN